MAAPPTGRDLADALRAQPGRQVDLRKLDPGDTLGHEKEASKARVAKDLVALDDVQGRLWASKERSLLVVLQGIDAAGKDGTIRSVISAFNVQGCAVTGFKAPTEEELAHDFLWRVHPHAPGRGEIAVFNRSHYEDVLVVRVHNYVPAKVWRARYDQINAFEETISTAGTRVVKFFLAISKDEQAKRLQARIEDPTKRWKFRLADLEERKLWDDYRKAYQEMLRRCSTERAPWYVIPADHKWFRDFAVAQILLHELEALKPRWPGPAEDLEGVVVT
jgi:PPK2 family polyphosphate:nucleotide phosphotransferase